MDIRKIQRLIEILQSSDVTEIEVSTGEERIRISRGAASMALMPAPTFVQTAPATHLSAPAPLSIPAASEPAGHVIKSPMVGTFYRAPAPDAAPFVEEGDMLKSGQVVCLIEAMKLLNEIESDVSGRILKILAENGQPVEYGEPLFIIDTNS